MASGAASPRVAARLADSRRRILDAARVVVAEQGFAAAQVAVVASVAEVATGSVYRHFPSKSSLFAEMLRSVCARELEVVRAIAAEPGRPAPDRIGDCVSAFVDRALRGEGLAYAVIVEPMDPGVDQVRLEARAALAGVFADLITEGTAAGELPPQDAGLAGAAIVGAFLESVAGPLASCARPAPDGTAPDGTAPDGTAAGSPAAERAAITAGIAGFCRSAVGGHRDAEGTRPS
jgi:AcrR family transcriptional regulator